MQHTIKHSVSINGIGLHSGKQIKMTLRPASVNTGLIFRRVDLSPVVDIKVDVNKIQEALMCTLLVEGETKISTIEHLMSALAAMRIDNLYVEIDGPEVPVMDGSAIAFVFLLQAAGIKKQTQARKFIRIKEPVIVKEGDKYAELRPYKRKGFRLHFTIDFSHPVINKTKNNLVFYLKPTLYMKQIARSRTFGFVKDIEKLHKNNLALGASLDNAIGITDDGVMNEDGLRYHDEFIRHKILDAIGDLYVVGPIQGRFRAHKSSHALNNRLLRELLANPDSYDVVEG